MLRNKTEWLKREKTSSDLLLSTLIDRHYLRAVGPQSFGVVFTVALYSDKVHQVSPLLFEQVLATFQTVI